MFKSKKYKNLEKTKNVLFEQNSIIRKDFIDMQKRYFSTFNELQDAKKEIKRLKQLLTRNKIEYKKEK